MFKWTPHRDADRVNPASVSLVETLGEWHTRYERGAFIDTGLAADAASDIDSTTQDAADQARAESQRRGWRFERIPADLTLIRRLLFGEWDDDFQVIEPGQRLEMSYDDSVVRVVSA